MVEKTEDSIRDSAKIILGFDKEEKDINQGTGYFSEICFDEYCHERGI